MLFMVNHLMLSRLGGFSLSLRMCHRWRGCRSPKSGQYGLRAKLPKQQERWCFWRASHLCYVSYTESQTISNSTSDCVHHLLQDELTRLLRGEKRFSATCLAAETGPHLKNQKWQAVCCTAHNFFRAFASTVMYTCWCLLQPV